MRILMPGGTGQIGTLLARHLYAAGHEITVLTRNPHMHPEQLWQIDHWDALNPGRWTAHLDRCEAVIHLSGRSVNCRYTPENRRQIYDSRVKPTLLLGEAIAASANPPRIWLNASTSTIYRHSLDKPQDELTGEPGDLPSERGTREPADLPETWSFSVDVAHRWEQALASVPTPQTRKICLRSSMVMSDDRGGVFSVFSNLARCGLGGTQGPGTQYVSWIHAADFCRATSLLLEHPEIADATGGAVNMTAPNPLPNAEFLRVLRESWGMRLGLPASAWMLELGARFLKTETELVLKSRRVVPGVLLQHGMEFQFPTWPEAARDLVARMRAPSPA